MIATNVFYAFEKANGAATKETGNSQGDTLTLQVMGSASTVSLRVYGVTDFMSKEWQLLNCINMTTLEVGTSITTKGIYVFPIEGLSNIKFDLHSVSGGEVSVFCRITKGD